MTIYCRKKFILNFSFIQYVAISNIHFKNCCAACAHGNALLFSVHPNQGIMSLSFTNIEITHDRCDAIRVDFIKRLLNAKNEAGNISILKIQL